MKNKPQLLPLKRAARVLGIKSASLQADADAGRVPFTKIGDEYLFVLSALEAALTERAQGKAPVVRT